MTELTQRVALITGASQGIGEASARHFARLGAIPVLLARSTSRLATIVDEIEGNGGEAMAITGDVSVFKDFERAVEAVMGRFGRLDILVNNAGLIEPVCRLADSDPEAWSRAADVNYKGVYHGMRAVLPPMLEAGSGTIINISSGAATGALEGWSHYCSSKAAALSLTRCGHKEYGDQGINVIGLSPGTVATPMQDVIRESGVNPVSQLDPSVHIPAQWVARTIAYLCTPAGAQHAGGDFSIKTNGGRAEVGLPLLDT